MSPVAFKTPAHTSVRLEAAKSQPAQLTSTVQTPVNIRGTEPAEKSSTIASATHLHPLPETTPCTRSGTGFHFSSANGRSIETSETHMHRAAALFADIVEDEGPEALLQGARKSGSHVIDDGNHRAIPDQARSSGNAAFTSLGGGFYEAKSFQTARTENQQNLELSQSTGHGPPVMDDVGPTDPHKNSATIAAGNNQNKHLQHYCALKLPENLSSPGQPGARIIDTMTGNQLMNSADLFSFSPIDGTVRQQETSEEVENIMSSDPHKNHSQGFILKRMAPDQGFPILETGNGQQVEVSRSGLRRVKARLGMPVSGAISTAVQVQESHSAIAEQNRVRERNVHSEHKRKFDPLSEELSGPLAWENSEPHTPQTISFGRVVKEIEGAKEQANCTPHAPPGETSKLVPLCTR